MLTSLLVTFLLAILAGAMVWVGYRAVRRKPPRFLIPAVVGATMLAFTIWNEYTWGSRTAAALPAGIEVIERIEDSTLLQPWTFLFPRVDRMIALDRQATLTNDRLPDHFLVELVLLERLMPARRTRVIVDCAGARQANVGDGALDPAALAAAAWAPMRREAGLFRAVCAPAASSSPALLPAR